MDPVTHLSAGALAGRAVADRLPPWKMMIFCLAAAGLPDTDSFLGLGPEDYLVFHRSFTHSILGVIVLSALVAGLFKLFWRKASLRFLFLIALAVMSLQVYLDLATTFGTQILWPFSNHRYAFPGIFIIDPFLTFGLLAILILSLVFKGRRKLLGLMGVVIAVGYPLLNLAIGAALEQSLSKRLASRGVHFDRIHMTTDLFTPFYWKVIAEQDGQYGVGAASLALSMPEPPFVTFPKVDPALAARLGEEAPFFRTWFWFAQYPVVSDVKETGNGRETTFLDLRFFSRSPIGRKLFPNYDPPFRLTARHNKEGKLESYLYHWHGRMPVTAVPD